MNYFLFAILFLSPHLSLLATNDENPFAVMEGKEYAEYMVDLRTFYIELDYTTDSIEAYRQLEQIKDVAANSKNKCWKLEAQLFEISVKYQQLYRESRKESYNVDDAFNDLKYIEEKALKSGCTYIYLRALRGIMNLYSRHFKNYEMAFETANTLDKALKDIPAAKFPDKLLIYLDIADLYYFFKDYESANRFYLKLLAEEKVAYKLFVLQSAYNSLGLIARTHYEDLDKSDKYFYKVLEIDPSFYSKAHMYDLWQGIAGGNIGKNHFLRKEFDKAIPLLELGMKKTINVDDYDYASGMTIYLADIYLKKNDLGKTKKYIDLSTEYIRKSYKKDKWHLLYPVMAKYYLKTNNLTNAEIYLDSALIARDDNNAEFNMTKLLRAEQKIHTYEQKIKNDELNAEKIRTNTYRNQLITITVSLIIFILLCIYLTIIYRKKRNAYKELVKRSQKWAQVATKDDDDDDDDEPEPTTGNEPDISTNCQEEQTIDKSEESGNGELDENLRSLFDKVQQLVLNKKKYSDSKISLDSLARELKVNRVYLSQAINRNTNKNFNTYINELRIKEAIRILSDKSSHKLSIDGIAFDSGFNDRKTFYRVFKKTTGLSPSDFKNTLS